MENGKCIFEFPSPVKGLNMLAFSRLIKAFSTDVFLEHKSAQ